MKKYARANSFILAVIMLFSVFTAISYAADDIVSGDFVFTANGKNLTLKKYNGKGGEVEVPSVVGGKKVTKIGVDAFGESYTDTPDEVRITKVILPTTVTEVERKAFLECTRLAEVSMLCVKSIGEGAFWDCKGLQRIAVSSALMEIKQDAFGGKCGNFKIYCESGSIAEEYAKTNAKQYAPLYAQSISLSKTDVSLQNGKSTTLSVKFSPSDVYCKDVCWMSSGKQVKVSQSGKVTGSQLGSATVTCISVLGDAKAECKVTVKLPAVKELASSETTFTSIKLSWKKVSEAQGYRLEMKKDGKWKKIYEGEKRSFTVKNLSAQKSYEFRVRAYTVNGSVKYNSDRTYLTAKTSCVGKVKNVKAKSTSTKSLSFTWSKAANAKGYAVYRENSSGKFEKTADVKECSYTCQLKSGTVGKFKVRAYAVLDGKKVYGSYSDVFTYCTKPSEVTGFSVSSKTKDSLTLKWKKISNADGYAVYCVTDEQHTLVKKVSSNSIKLTGLKANTKYTYCVRAYIKTTLGTVYGGHSKYSATTEPAISAQQIAAADITSAFLKLKGAKELYVGVNEKVTVAVSSCSGNQSAKTLAAAYAEMFCKDERTAYDFKNGKDENGLTPEKLFTPENGFSLGEKDIKSAVREKDGSGIRFTVQMKSETAQINAVPRINSHIWGMIDTKAIAQAATEDVEIQSLSVTYSGTLIKTKINASGAFDTFCVEVPFEIKTVCVFANKNVETVFSGKIIKNYILTWW